MTNLFCFSFPPAVSLPLPVFSSGFQAFGCSGVVAGVGREPFSNSARLCRGQPSGAVAPLWQPGRRQRVPVLPLLQLWEMMPSSRR